MSVAFDTNVFVYSIDPKGGRRHHLAMGLLARALRSGRCIVLFQTLAEFYWVSTRKLATPPDRARAFIDGLRTAVRVHTAVEPDLDPAMLAAQRHGLSFWDALLWATADRVGVRWLITEDFQDGRVIGGVTFVDPFNAANDRLLERALPPVS